MRRLLDAIGINIRLLHVIEAGLTGLFFIQGLRFLIGIFYSRISSASIAALIPPEAISQITSLPGFIDPITVRQEIIFLGYILALPLLGIVIGRFRLMLVIAVAITASGRLLMIADTDISTATSAALTVGGGLFYIMLLSKHRPLTFPLLFIISFAADQLIRAVGNTLDPTWSADFFLPQVGLYLVAMVISVANYLLLSRQNEGTTRGERTNQGLITFWGGISLGVILFLEISLLSLPNAIAARAGVDYATLVPILIVATLLPILPAVRAAARQIIGLFDATVRGWVWLLIIALLLVVGTRFNGIFSAIGFVGAQFTVSLLWWWLIRPQSERERNLSGLWTLLGALVFVLFVLFDLFTYEYAYIQNFPLESPLAVLNDTLIPLIRGFRGLGYAIILLAALLAVMPMIQSQRRIAWRGGSTFAQGLLLALAIGAAAFSGAYFASPPIVPGVFGIDNLRVGTYNIHGGYSEFYSYELERIAQTIEQSGANVVLLQEVEAGRLTSFGVNQPLWLARRLGMDTRFYPTNEGLQGLAVLSNVEVVFNDGVLLPGIGQQTGLQRVQIRPAENLIVTVYNTWLGLLVQQVNNASLADQEQDQKRQFDEIIRIISEQHPNRQLGRTILGGTFNNIPDSPLIQSVDDRGFSDPFAGSSLERSATLVRTGINARLDYVWIYPEIAEGVGVIDSDASDHRLAFVSISLREP